MLTKIANKLKSLLGKDELSGFKKYNFTVVFAFECNGKRYYTFADESDIPAGRYIGLHLQRVALDSRMDSAFIDAFAAKITKEIDTVVKAGLSGQKVEKPYNELMMTLAELKKRSAMIFNPLFVLREATVLYFTADEDLYSYDEETANKKILEWTKGGIAGFFLQKPVRRLLPYKVDSEEDLSLILAGAQTNLQEFLTSVQESDLQRRLAPTTASFLESLAQNLANT